VTLDQGIVLGIGETQDVTFTATNAAGTLSQQTVHLTAGTKAAQVAAINTALQGSGAGSPLLGLVAVDSDAAALGSIVIEGTGSFNVTIGTASVAGDGFTQTGGAVQGVTVSSIVQGTGGALDVLTAADAGTAVTALANAVNNLGAAQAVVGKGENNFTYATNLAQSQLTNEATSESGLRDANMATEAANLTKAQILLQAGVAALAQANAAPQNILALLKG
jgi:flagellin